ncbi:hypothetical protein DSO57_1030761 [Entomophthora muscae]|uniref:Uncharacterized protein n=1 Tax=Entomophthora muscae TaxID=34485 RepID=A0ACC2TZA0_9FUNG|nr:hypothetical protein DSO57_1030761 [Entomophthora muscae]
MLPSFILQEIISLLCPRQALSFRLVSREFSQVIFPVLLSVQTLREKGNNEYRDFLLKNGKYARGLIIRDIDHFYWFQESGLTLNEIFPNVRSIALDTMTVTRCNFIEDFASQCLELEKLKHLSLSDMDLEGEYFYPSGYDSEDIDYPLHEDPYHVMKPLLNTLKSLFTNFWPKAFLNNIKESSTLKKLFISTGCRGHTMKDLRDVIPYCHVILTNEYGPIISSKEEPTTSNKWLHFGDWNAHYYALVPNKVYEEYVVDIFPTLGHMEVTNFHENSDYIKKVLHCTIINVYNSINDTDILMGFEEIPSLELILTHHIAHIKPARPRFKTIKLSLLAYDPNFRELFAWMIDAFPALEHLYLDNAIRDSMLPLQHVAFPFLTHFYSKVSQSDYFWIELIQAAPNLLYIHCNSIPGNLRQLKQMSSTLKVRGYTAIFGSSRELNDVSGFTAALTH